jgi:hypothetical protein
VHLASCSRLANPLAVPQTTGGELAEWLRSGLQIRVHEFDSRTRLHLKRAQSIVLTIKITVATKLYWQMQRFPTVQNNNFSGLK